MLRVAEANLEFPATAIPRHLNKRSICSQYRHHNAVVLDSLQNFSLHHAVPYESDVGRSAGGGEEEDEEEEEVEEEAEEEAEEKKEKEGMFLETSSRLAPRVSWLTA